MNQEYSDWIETRLAEGDPWNMCSVWSIAMQMVFPELRLTRGYVHVPGIGERPHWWLVTPGGEIVDPTKQQFYDLPRDGRTGYYGGAGIAQYRELPDGFVEPVGKCANCGDLIYPRQDGSYDSTVCSDSCFSAYAAYLYGGVYK